MIFSRTLDVNYREEWPITVFYIDKVKRFFDARAIPYAFEHHHRAWEYGIVMEAIAEVSGCDILDVGGAASLFAPACNYWLGEGAVRQVDPRNRAGDVMKQNKVLGTNVEYEQVDFFDYQKDREWDIVTSISVIEHIPNYEDFVLKLANFVKPGGLLALTTDFHPTGRARVTGHLRTYNERSLLKLAKLLDGFSFLEDGYDYTYKGEDVNSYTFASLILRRDING